MPDSKAPSRVLPQGWSWEPCKTCGAPRLVVESGSVYGGTIGYGCARCLCRALDALEKTEAFRKYPKAKIRVSK